MSSRFAGGRNIALKVPSHQYDATVQFYRDVLGLKVLQNHLPAVGFEFGSNQLWIDRVAGLSQAELWLENVTEDVTAASTHFKAAGVVRCDEIEPCRKGSMASGSRTRHRSFISFQSLVSMIDRWTNRPVAPAALVRPLCVNRKQ